MCAKLHTMAASKNRDHMPWSLYYIARSCHIYIGGIVRAHPVRGESRIQRNANREFLHFAAASRIDQKRSPMALSPLGTLSSALALRAMLCSLRSAATGRNTLTSTFSRVPSPYLQRISLLKNSHVIHQSTHTSFPPQSPPALQRGFQYLGSHYVCNCFCDVTHDSSNWQ